MFEAVQPILPTRQKQDTVNQHGKGIGDADGQADWPTTTVRVGPIDRKESQSIEPNKTVNLTTFAPTRVGETYRPRTTSTLIRVCIRCRTEPDDCPRRAEYSFRVEADITAINRMAEGGLTICGVRDHRQLTAGNKGNKQISNRKRVS